MHGEWKQWPLLLTVTMGLCVTAIPGQALGVLMIPMTEGMGWTRAEFAVTSGISIVVMALCAPLVGKLVDTFGARKVALTGTPIGCFFLAMVSLVSGFEGYMANQLVTAIAFSLASPVVWSVAVGSRFLVNGGLALSIAMCGSSLIGATVPPITANLVAELGWRGTWVSLAAITFLMSMPLAWFQFYDAKDLRRKSAPGQAASLTGISLRDALKKREFWLLAGFLVVEGSCAQALVLNLIPLLRDRGMDAYLAAGALSTMSVSAICGRLVCGYLADRYFAPRVIAVSLMLPMVGCLWLLSGETGGLQPFVAAAMIGFGTGAVFPMLSYLIIRFFGLRTYATIYGVMFGWLCFGLAVGPLVAAMLYDRFGDYDHALRFLVGGYLTAAAVLLVFRRYPNHGTQQASGGTVAEGGNVEGEGELAVRS